MCDVTNLTYSNFSYMCSILDSRKGNISDSDTDSDVVFESRNKAPARFNIETRNGHKPSRNGFTKMGRRVKT